MPGDADARILVIDDEAQNLQLIRGMLSAAGYRHVTTMRRSGEAIDSFQELEPDLLLLDLHMPPPDGFAVMEAVRGFVDPDDFFPILVLSADTSQDVRERALSEGASDFVGKPLQLAEVLLRIRNLLARRRQHRRLQASHATAAAELARRDTVARVESDRLELISSRVREVLSTGGPTILYQPIIELALAPEHDVPGLVLDLRDHRARSVADGRPGAVGFEALARFYREPTQGPDRWFNDAAEVKLGLELELASIAIALEPLATMPAPLFVSVNASWTTIVTEAFHDLLAPYEGERVVVELTEHQRVSDYEELARSVTRLHERGIRIAVDDAGAGFASLNHILRLGPDVVKLDRALIVGVDRDPIRRSMIAALVHFSTETGIALIAEGVEEVGELEALRGLGVRHAQGFHLAMPSDLATALTEVG